MFCDWDVTRVSEHIAVLTEHFSSKMNWQEDHQVSSSLSLVFLKHCAKYSNLT